MSTVLVGAVVAIVTAVVTSAVQSWLTRRAALAADLRDDRAGAYALLWRRLDVLSSYPWADTRHRDVAALHRDLRRWYYDEGGMLLSENARARYGEVQRLLGWYLVRTAGPGAVADDDRIDDTWYGVLAGAASALRTAVTEDLSTRRLDSALATFGRWRVHRRQAREAAQRWRTVDLPLVPGRGRVPRAPRGRPVEPGPWGERVPLDRRDARRPSASPPGAGPGGPPDEGPGTIAD